MAKCALTGEKIPETFLNKPLGTLIKDEDGKRYYVSSAVQKQFNNDKAAILKAIQEKK